LELGLSEVTFSDEILTVENEFNVTLNNFGISKCTEMQMTKGNKSAFSQVSTSTASA